MTESESELAAAAAAAAPSTSSSRSNSAVIDDHGPPTGPNPFDTDEASAAASSAGDSTFNLGVSSSSSAAAAAVSRGGLGGSGPTGLVPQTERQQGLPTSREATPSPPTDSRPTSPEIEPGAAGREQEDGPAAAPPAPSLSPDSVQVSFTPSPQSAATTPSRRTEWNTAPELPQSNTDPEPQRSDNAPAAAANDDSSHLQPRPTPASEPDITSESTPAPSPDLPPPLNEKQPPPPAEHSSIGRQLYARFRRAYCPKVDPALVLPTCPDDKEKRLYVHTNRVLLYIFGVVSFLSLGAGMWLFALSASPFYWYGAFAGMVVIYLAVSYAVGIIGRDWDETSHTENLARFPLTDPAEAPAVDIFLPCCREPIEILRNTYVHVARLEWPAGRLCVHVMDDGADGRVEALAREFGFEYSVRADRPRLRKAGNLRWTFARTEAEFFAIFDADFCPRPDFLRELMVEHLADDRTAIVQSPQFFRVLREQTWVEQGAGATQELFYRVVQVNRDRWGAAICVGTNAVYRRAALAEVGGTAEIGFSEDVHTGFGAVDRGWLVKYVPLCLAAGVCPNAPRAFFSQQMRWARGSTTLLTNPGFWTSRLTVMQKVCYLSGFMYYIAVALNIFLAPIAGTLLLAARPVWFRYWNLAFAVPSILYGIAIMRVWARASYGFNVQHVMTVQSYAYLVAIKDRLLGIELLWVATGEAHRRSGGSDGSGSGGGGGADKFRNMRILCACWTMAVVGAMIGVVAWRIITGFPWYHPLPLIVINAYNLWINHYFIVCGW